MLKNIEKFNYAIKSLGFYARPTDRFIAINSYTDHQTYVAIVGNVDLLKMYPIFVELDKDSRYSSSKLIEACQTFITKEGSGVIMVNSEVMVEEKSKDELEAVLNMVENNFKKSVSEQGLIMEIDEGSIKVIDPLKSIIYMIIIIANGTVFVKNDGYNSTNLSILKEDSEKARESFYSLALRYAKLIKESREVTIEELVEEIDPETEELANSIIEVLGRFNRIAVPLPTINSFSAIVNKLATGIFEWIDDDYTDSNSMWNKFKEKTVLYVNNENKTLSCVSMDEIDMDYNEANNEDIQEESVIGDSLLEPELLYDTMTFDKVSSKESLIIKRDDIKDDLNINYKLEDLNDGWFKETSSMGEINYYSSSVVKINIKEEEWFVIDSMHSLF